MDSLSVAARLGMKIVVAGKTYELSQLRIADWAEAGRRLRNSMQQPVNIVAALKEGLPDFAVRHLVSIAYDDQRFSRPVSIAEIETWFDSPEGKLCMMSLSLQGKHPDISLHEAEDVLLAFMAGEFSMPGLEKIETPSPADIQAEVSGLPAENPTSEPATPQAA
jgi:hypothetical protein